MMFKYLSVANSATNCLNEKLLSICDSYFTLYFTFCVCVYACVCIQTNGAGILKLHKKEKKKGKNTEKYKSNF